jgi:hypothetical protein
MTMGKVASMSFANNVFFFNEKMDTRDDFLIETRKDDIEFDAEEAKKGEFILFMKCAMLQHGTFGTIISLICRYHGVSCYFEQRL